MKCDEIRFDRETGRWFKKHPDVASTVVCCKDCGLYYKPSLGHKCKEVKRDV